MEVTVQEGKREFTISADLELILKIIEEMRKDYEDERYVWYGTSPEFGDEDFKYVTKEEFNRNIDKFKEETLSIINEMYLKGLVETFPRKKNGTFNRRNVRELAECSNCEAIHEWHNTWIYYILHLGALDDTRLLLTLVKKTDTPC